MTYRESTFGTVEQLLDKTGAKLNGHFILSSGLHSEHYVQCAKLLQYPHIATHVAHIIYERLLTNGITHCDFIASPAIGGIVIGQEIARLYDVRHIFVEKNDTGKPELRRGFELFDGECGVVVEDVVTTGKSTLEVVDVINENGGKIIAGCSIINRSGTDTPNLGFPYVFGVKLDFNTYTPDNCPLCISGIPAVKPGSRKK